MSASAWQQRLQNAWYQGAPGLCLLRPLSLLYARVAQQRRQNYLSSPERIWQSPVPLIVVGNITLGGTGKTPMTLWLIDWLQARGLRVGVVSRGYGGKPPSQPWQVDPARDGPEVAGDEPLLIARRGRVPVVIDANRPRACRHLLAREPVDILISDDGLQHYALGRDIELAMLDHQRGVGNARCLPEGPLREPAERLQSVDLVIRTGAAADSDQGYAMTLEPTHLVNIRSGESVAIANWGRDMKVVALAGIGHPQRFFASLQALGFSAECHAFADHAEYTALQLQALSAGRPLLMTEKDAVKCREFAAENWWYLRVDAQLSEAFASRLNTLLAAIMAQPR
ncbi:tetraacyldisaccharide 4'-kinase [Halopseudomonas salegens]|uniref:Tetraacyldisaccharide 4'-kinase n=1 Tax=Halopseudomonas salegens TaxID=1434072 RepID=A0A1H2EY64_9GAMM|nr:tetraacyldisaccharide 4'-kinase [Halopseudomonas salegens]SDT99979.1 lipid-A-disaccharide kinase [Halopseudomonas salegens]